MVRLLIASLMALVGALVALPNPVASQIDLSGDWNLTLTGDVSTFEPCETSVEQIGVALTFVVTCQQPIGSGTLTGSIDPNVGDFDVSGILSGIVGGFLFEFAGNAAPDGSSFQGTWTISDVPAFGGFSGQRKEQPTPTPTPTPTPVPGVMEVDCDASAAGVQSDCTHSTGGTFSMQVHVTEPPEGGYIIFDVKLGWTDKILDYLPTANPQEEGLWPECDIAARLDNRPGEPSVLFTCVPSPGLSEGDTFTGPVLQFQFQCQQDGNTPLVLVPRPGDPQQGSHFVDVNFSPIEPVLVNATVACAAPTPTPLPPTPIGGIGIFPGAPGDAPDAGGAAVLAWLAAGATTAAVTLVGAAWFARRRRAG